MGRAMRVSNYEDEEGNYAPRQFSSKRELSADEDDVKPEVEAPPPAAAGGRPRRNAKPSLRAREAADAAAVDEMAAPEDGADEDVKPARKRVKKEVKDEAKAEQVKEEPFWDGEEDKKPLAIKGAKGKGRLLTPTSEKDLAVDDEFEEPAADDQDEDDDDYIPGAGEHGLPTPDTDGSGAPAGQDPLQPPASPISRAALKAQERALQQEAKLLEQRSKELWKEWVKLHRWRQPGYKHDEGVETISRTDAVSYYRLTGDELDTVPHTRYPNPHHSQAADCYSIDHDAVLRLFHRKHAVLAGQVEGQPGFWQTGEELANKLLLKLDSLAADKGKRRKKPAIREQRAHGYGFYDDWY